MAAGFVSVFGFNKIQPWVLARFKVHDSCGIYNLHGMPSLVGGIASVIVAAYKNSGGRTSDSAIYGTDAEYQWYHYYHFNHKHHHYPVILLGYGSFVEFYQL